jgi:hypothetical protein
MKKERGRNRVNVSAFTLYLCVEKCSEMAKSCVEKCSELLFLCVEKCIFAAVLCVEKCNCHGENSAKTACGMEE